MDYSDLIFYLKTHDDQRLYREADDLMNSAAHAINDLLIDKSVLVIEVNAFRKALIDVLSSEDGPDMRDRVRKVLSDHTEEPEWQNDLQAAAGGLCQTAME